MTEDKRFILNGNTICDKTKEYCYDNPKGMQNEEIVELLNNQNKTIKNQQEKITILETPIEFLKKETQSQDSTEIVMEENEITNEQLIEENIKVMNQTETLIKAIYIILIMTIIAYIILIIITILKHT